MDVHCSTCGEPWDVDHLRHDAIFETDLASDEIEAWARLRPREKLSEFYRQKFKAAGFVFGDSVLNVTHCPACPKGATPDPDKAALKAGLVEILGDDEDAIAGAFDELGL